MERGGNVLDVERNKEISSEAARVEDVYDKLSNYKGPVSDALNQAAKEYAAGGTTNAIADRLYEQIREIVESTLRGGKEPDTELAARRDSGGEHTTELGLFDAA